MPGESIEIPFRGVASIASDKLAPDKSVTSGKAGGVQDCESFRAVCFVPLPLNCGKSGRKAHVKEVHTKTHAQSIWRRTMCRILGFTIINLGHHRHAGAFANPRRCRKPECGIDLFLGTGNH
jgi:hypothetical protein